MRAVVWSPPKYPILGEKDPRAKTHAVMKLGALLNRIRFLVENSYVTFGGEVFKQEIGIAMGLIPAGAIASLVCYSYELDYLNRCLKKWKSMDPTDPGYAEMHARTLFAMLSRRYIDDNLHVLIDLANFNSEEALYDDRTVFDGSQDGTRLDGLYPRTSTGPDDVEIEMPCHLECVHQPSREVAFLDSRIKVDLQRRRIITKVYDKRSEMNCYQNVRTFPHVESILPREVPFNVITSQFIRFGRRTSCFGDFMESASDLVARMCNHGYDPRAVERKVQSFERYWYRYCPHLGRWSYFIEQFPALVRRRRHELAAPSIPAPTHTPPAIAAPLIK